MDGPFAETKELIAGFWLLKAKSKEEVLEWVYRIPGAKGEIDHFGGTFEIEVRQLFEIEDFPADVFPPEEAAREQALRDELERKAKR